VWLFIILRVVYVCRIQLAVNVQIPQGYGGLGGKAIYIGKNPKILILIKHLMQTIHCTSCAYVILRHRRKLYG